MGDSGGDAFQAFHLSTMVAEAHGSDIRSSTALVNGHVVTGSNDRLVREFALQEDNSYQLLRTMVDNENSVGAVLELPASAVLPSGGVASAGYDHQIRVWAKADEDENSLSGDVHSLYALSGHEKQVCALAVTSSGRVISGSWDGTARVWNEVGCESVLKGHENAVWAVLELSNETIVTASADRTIRLWKGSEEVVRLTRHTDVVRSLAEVPGIGFLSAANDSTVILWSYDGEYIRSFYGHTEYIYCVRMIDEAHFATVGEDRTLRIWSISEESPVQTIEMPGMQWTVSVLPNGDIATGGGDGILRVWTQNPARLANQDVHDAFSFSLQQAKLETRNAAGGGLDLRNVPDRSALQTPGQNDGETKMVREGEMVRAYKWSETAQDWDLIGDVVSASPNMVNGKVYDHVIDVELDGATLKLGHNTGDNPYMSAQKFIDDNFLDQDHLEEIAQFVIRNVERREGQTLSTFESGPGNADPFTGSATGPYGGGGGAAAPQPMEGGGGGVNLDPFTGVGASKVEKEVPRKAAAPSAPFPVKSAVLFQAVRVTTLKEKLYSREEAASLSDDDRLSIAKVLTAVGAGQHSSHAFDPHELSLCASMLQWADASLAPVLDLCRCLFLFASVHDGSFVEESFSNIMVMLNSSESDVNHMLGLWAIANAYGDARTVSFLHENEGLIVDTLELIAPKSSAKQHIGLATVLLNMASATKAMSPDVAVRSAKILQTVLPQTDNDEARYRIVCALGTLASRKAVRAAITAELGKLPGAVGALAEDGGVSAKTKSAAKALVALLRK